jgi:peptidoglycan/xylan/chitin deacetylase (PgdA/CDA1 family)
VNAGRRRLGRSLGRLGLAAAWYDLPSVCVLGQWAPVRLEALPAGMCRWRGPASSNAVALTFDDGPSPTTTPRTLELLDALGMKATFFVLGSLVEAHPELVGEIRRRGHGVGLHGYHHRHHLLHGPRWVRRDTEAALAALAGAGVRPRWYRPPYGQLSAATVLEARRHGMEVVLWSAWGREWAETDPQAVAARLTRRIEPGAVVLLHDNDALSTPGTAARAWRALELLAPVLSERALRVVALDTLMDAGAAPPARSRPGAPRRPAAPAGQ